MDQASVVDPEHAGDSLARGSDCCSHIPFVDDLILSSLILYRDKGEHLLGDDDCSEIAQVADSGLVPTYYRDDNKSVENETQSSLYCLNSVFPVSPSEEDVEKNQSRGEDKVEEKDYKLPQTLVYLIYLINLALFGILGVFTRYLLRNFFGPGFLMLTGDDTPFYLDLPSHVLGSFLMGWLGVVFKLNIHHYSPLLASGLSTGYLGSLTSFSGWNQSMINFAFKSHWTFGIIRILVGVAFVKRSIRTGVECASYLHNPFFVDFSKYKKKQHINDMRVSGLRKHIIAAAVTIFFLVLLLWSLSGALAGAKANNTVDDGYLWLGCLMGPPGVWARWYLARLNGRGIGRNRSLKWLPLGTLSANIIAACLMASLSTLSAVVNTKRWTTVISGIQFGFVGCLSSVSSFGAEVYAMRESAHSERAFIYELVTILPTFALGSLIYSVLI